MKYLDMPADNEQIQSYEDLMTQVRRGRVAGIVSIKHRTGYQGVYMVSADMQVTEDNSLRACAKIVCRAHEAAEANGHLVLTQWPTDRR